MAGAEPSRYQYERVTTPHHSALYATNCSPTPEYAYLRENPHRLNLARVFLRRLPPPPSGPSGAAPSSPAAPILAADVSAIGQRLHLWNGSLESASTPGGPNPTLGINGSPISPSI